MARNVKSPDKFVPGRGYTRTDWEEVSDNPEWTAEDFARARPFREVFPKLAASIDRARGRPRSASPKTQISIRLDAAVVEKFKATGKGWQARMNDVLKKARV